MPSERATVIGSIIVGMFFVALITLMDYSLSIQPLTVALVIDGKPHYGSLRTYTWSSAGGGGGAHYPLQVREVIEIENATEVIVRGSWDRRFIELSNVYTDRGSLSFQNLEKDRFVIDLPSGEYWLSVTSRWESKYSETVLYECCISVK